jgi:hypothetical protein
MSNNNFFDDNAEIRAMILLSLPYPPLPVVCSGLSDDSSSLGEQRVITTHDVISKLLEEALINHRGEKSNEVHMKRQQKQQRVLGDFVQELCHLQENQGVKGINLDDLYNVYAKYTTKHIESFFDSDRVLPSMGIQNLSTVERGDVVHAKMCDYMAGQAILLKISPDTTEAFKNMPFHEMLLMAKDRIVFEAKADDEEET